MATKIAIVNVNEHDSLQASIVLGLKLVEDSFIFNLSEYMNILLKPNLLRATKDAYISCLCCMDICPQQAIKAKSRGFFGLFHKY